MFTILQTALVKVQKKDATK